MDTILIDKEEIETTFTLHVHTKHSPTNTEAPMIAWDHATLMLNLFQEALDHHYHDEAHQLDSKQLPSSILRLARDGKSVGQISIYQGVNGIPNSHPVAMPGDTIRLVNEDYKEAYIYGLELFKPSSESDSEWNYHIQFNSQPYPNPKHPETVCSSAAFLNDAQWREINVMAQAIDPAWQFNPKVGMWTNRSNRMRHTDVINVFRSIENGEPPAPF